MNNKRPELLAYTRVLYERQNNKASKAGMTSWAVIAGIIYVIWHMFDAISQLAVSQIYFYYVFSVVHLTLLGMIALMRANVMSSSNRAFDYRIMSTNHIDMQMAATVIAIMGIPLYCVYRSMPLNIIDPFQLLQQQINYWFLVVFLLWAMVGFAQEIYIKKKTSLPPPRDLVMETAPYYRVLTTVINIVCLELFLGNFAIIIREIYGHNDKGIVYTAAFDVSLIIFGLIVLSRSIQSGEYLSRLSNLERDIVIHSLSDKETLERLQDEFLGNYVGDWIEKKLKQVRKKADDVIELSKKAESIKVDVEKIDKEYEHERNGRINKYVASLQSSFELYEECLEPLLDWLKNARVHSSFSNDEFMSSMVKSSLEELKSTNENVREIVNQAARQLKSHLA